MYTDPEEEKLFRKALDKGIALFNQQRFEEAYEIWEERWQEETTEGAALLQGLLQIAVGFAKLQGGGTTAAIKLLDSGAEKLRAYAPESYDLDVAAILRHVDELKSQLQQ